MVCLKITKYLEFLKNNIPNQKFVVETPNGAVEFKLRDAQIYEGMRGEIIIDTE